MWAPVTWDHCQYIEYDLIMQEEMKGKIRN